MREDICIGVLKHRFSNDVADLENELSVFVDEMYETLFTQRELDIIDTMKAASNKKWFHKYSSFDMKFGSDYAKLTFGGNMRLFLGCWVDDITGSVIPYAKFREDRILPYDLGCAHEWPATSREATHYSELKTRAEDLIDAIQSARNEVLSILASVTTVGKLLSIWPEIKPFVEQLDTVVIPKNLPAAKRVQVNNLVHLPVKEDAA
jgi:hypothetical protein